MQRGIFSRRGWYVRLNFAVLLNRYYRADREDFLALSFTLFALGSSQA